MKSALLPAVLAANTRHVFEKPVFPKELLPAQPKGARPVVGATANNEWYCTKSVDRLQSGFTSIDDVNSKWEDDDFGPYGNEQIWWDGFTPAASFSYYQNYLGQDILYFERFQQFFGNDVHLFDPDGHIDWTDVNQGGAGTCYIKASMASLAEFPDLVRATFLNDDTNSDGIYNVRFYIRGKPWVVSIDDYLLFHDGGLLFSSTSKDGNAIWGALLEKAWAKVKGNYIISEGGMTANGIRALTGVPVYDYYGAEFGVDSTSQDTMWNLLIDANDKNYIMGAGTAGAGDDSQTNDCGIAMSHAYSLVSAFEMTDAAGTVHKCLLIRNPWGSNGYTWTWAYDDANWTDDLVAQVPHEFDPRAQSNSETGLFVVPFEAFLDNSDVGYCFVDLQIGHDRSADGFVETWYDAIDMEQNQEYYLGYTPTTTTDDVYFTVETYAFNIVPYECTAGVDEDLGQYVDVPVVSMAMYYNDASGIGTTDTAFYADYQHQPMMVSGSGYNTAGFEFQVAYYWVGSARRDFTFKVYAIDGNLPTNVTTGETNMLYTDGSSPSEFDYIAETFPEGRDSGSEEPETNRYMDGYTGCMDTAFGAVDAYGDGCEWYFGASEQCGMYDGDLLTQTMCCVCGGGCYDTQGDAVDSQGYGCEYYNAVPTECGDYDTTDFVAESMCCACQTADLIPTEEDDTTTDDTTDDTTEEETCADSAGDLTDSQGNTCTYYDATPADCGLYDTDDFIAGDMCCSCECADSNGAALDAYGDGCEYYDEYPAACGLYDDDDFASNTMCCACIEYEGCLNTAGTYVDTNGNTCEYYFLQPEDCGLYDTADFISTDMCCGCASDYDYEDTDICIDQDVELGVTDAYGDSCSFYDSVPEECGYWDTDDFVAYDLCCSCIAKAEEDTSGDACYDEWEGCCDSADGATDEWGDGCSWYFDVPEDCGWYDTEDFAAFDLCCACIYSELDYEEEQSEDDSVVIDGDCENTNREETDIYGDDCSWYDYYPDTCGMGDHQYFTADEMCCSCGGGSTGDEIICEDSNGDSTDVDGYGCDWYTNNPQDCGYYDTDDFSAYDMCCGCGGGGGDYFDPATAEVTSLMDVFASAESPADALLAIIYNPWVLFVWFDFF